MLRSSVLAALAVLAAFTVATPAHAYVFGGNPKVVLEVDRPAGDLTSADVWLASVKVHSCAGGTPTVVLVDAAVDLTQPWTATVPGGDLCGVSVHYDSAMEVTHNGWTVSHDEPKTQVVLNGWNSVSVPLVPFTVEQGTFSGVAPQLVLTLEP
ncbi:MAG: hypothetical protein ACI8PZ_003194 [Myxococcota bacterium]|jgi:hypothetical protein